MRVVLLSTATLLFLFLQTAVIFGRVVISFQDQHSPRYEVISSQYVDKTFLLVVVIKPKFLNCKNMKSLAKTIKTDFPKENELEVAIFINRDAAKNFSLNQHSPDYEKNKEAFRGSYRLNRDTGEEFLTYAPTGRRAIEREEMDLRKEEPNQCFPDGRSKNKAKARNALVASLPY